MSKHMLKTFLNKNTSYNQHECNQYVFGHRLKCFEYFLVLWIFFNFLELNYF
jgi:hypothetical protein